MVVVVLVVLVVLVLVILVVVVVVPLLALVVSVLLLSSVLVRPLTSLTQASSLLAASPSLSRKWECTEAKYARKISSRPSLVRVVESKDCFSSEEKPQPLTETANGHPGASMPGLSWPTEDDTLITRPCGRKSGRSESHTRRVPK